MSHKLALAAAVVAAGLLAMTTASQADVAMILSKVSIRKAPVPGAKKLGTLEAGARVEVDPQSCTGGYCRLANDFGPQGWVSEDFIEFVTDEDEPEAAAEACFYDKADFGGASFCLAPGDVQAKLSSWNDRISSIEIIGDISVDLCADRDLYGICGTFTSDAARLPAKLNNKVTSIEVSEAD